MFEIRNENWSARPTFDGGLLRIPGAALLLDKVNARNCFLLRGRARFILERASAACFLLRVGMPLIGKSAKTGQVPWWSYVLFWGFHLPTWLYTELHTRHSVHTGTPVATEVRHA